MCYGLKINNKVQIQLTTISNTHNYDQQVLSQKIIC